MEIMNITKYIFRLDSNIFFIYIPPCCNRASLRAALRPLLCFFLDDLPRPRSRYLGLLPPTSSSSPSCPLSASSHSWRMDSYVWSLAGIGELLGGIGRSSRLNDRTGGAGGYSGSSGEYGWKGCSLDGKSLISSGLPRTTPNVLSRSMRASRLS